MNKNSEIVLGVAVVLLVGLVVAGAYASKRGTGADFRVLQAKVSGYAATSAGRVGKAVITLPDNSTLVGLINGEGQYTSVVGTAAGTVTVSLNKEKTEFVPGADGTTNPPRLDVAAPMFIEGDKAGGSAYVVLFNDRGDAAIEKSYARLGGSDVSISSISMLPGDAPGTEYRVDVSYTQQGEAQSGGQVESNMKEVIIPVVNGHFDPENTEEVK